MIFDIANIVVAVGIVVAAGLVVEDGIFEADPYSSPQISTNTTSLYYGDVALTPIQRYVLNHENLGYNAVRGINHRWKDGIIPYIIDCSLEHLRDAVQAIQEAMEQWEEKTCIRFIKHTKEKSYVTFYRDTQCWGNVGKMSQPRVSVGHGCEKNFIMAHEIGHVIGLFHEHNRPDRDEWIELQSQNIGYHKEAFNIVKNSDSYGVPYDYESIMHYPWSAFSINGQATMKPRKLHKGKVPYQKISKDDVKLVSRMYNCKEIERKRQRDKTNLVEKRKVEYKRCVDFQKKCPTWKSWGLCRIDSVTDMCPKSCDACAKPHSLHHSNIPIAQPLTTGVWTDIWPNRHYLGVGILCRDYYKECKTWAKEGDCRRSPKYMFRRCSKSCKKLNFHIECDVEVRIPPGSCSSPLGLGVTGDVSSRLADSAFSSSTQLTTGVWVAPASSARLYNEDHYDTKRIGAWCADNQLPNQYVQVDLGNERRITYIATQGRPKFYERVSKFTIQYSNTPSNFQTYREDGHEKVFNGNCDYRSPVLNRFKNGIVGRYIRFIPKEWNYPCVRMELYGC